MNDDDVQSLFTVDGVKTLWSFFVLFLFDFRVRLCTQPKTQLIYTSPFSYTSESLLRVDNPKSKQ